jgi:hypothetical protein
MLSEEDRDVGVGGGVKGEFECRYGDDRVFGSVYVVVVNGMISIATQQSQTPTRS